MTPQQQAWLRSNPKHSIWRPHPPVTLRQWADIGRVTPGGQFIPEGKPVPFHPDLTSAGDTLYVVPEGCIKVGREYDVV